MKSGIYKITNPKGKIYIGQSVNAHGRINEYKRLHNCNEQFLIYNSLKKYGVENHLFEIIETCEKILLNEREHWYMNFYNTRNRKFGLNIRCAGSMGSHSETTIKKMSLAHTGKKMSDETKKKMSEYKKKNPVNYWLGKKRSKIDREKFRLSHLGMVNSNKPIIQYDLQMQELNRFEGATDAARKLKLGRTAIKNNLIGLSKTCNKTIFKYVPSY